MKPRVVVVGSSNVDMVANVSHAPGPGETVLCDTYFTAPGGKGANQAVAAARMGAQVGFVACLGEDSPGVEARGRFAADEIDVQHVRLIPDAPTGTAFIWVDAAGENRIVVASGANGRLAVEHVEAAAGLIREAAILLVQLEIPLSPVRRALEIARDAGVMTILNPAPAVPLEKDLLSLVDILTPNESEADLVLGEGGPAAGVEIATGNQRRAEQLAERLLDRGVRTVCMTLGARGALVQTAGQAPRLIPAPEVSVVDTTAAGDVFNGALASILGSGESLTRAVGLAVRAASMACTVQGAQPSIPTLEMVLARG